MSVILFAIAIVGFIAAILASAIAMAKPNHRKVAIAVAACGFGTSAATVGFAVFVISQMN